MDYTEFKRMRGIISPQEAKKKDANQKIDEPSGALPAGQEPDKRRRGRGRKTKASADKAPEDQAISDTPEASSETMQPETTGAPEG
jgi:hypothetical protein